MLRLSCYSRAAIHCSSFGACEPACVLQSYKATGSVDSVKVMVGQGADLQANTVPGGQYNQQGSKNPAGMLAS